MWVTSIVAYEKNKKHSNYYSIDLFCYANIKNMMFYFIAETYVENKINTIATWKSIFNDYEYSLVDLSSLGNRAWPYARIHCQDFGGVLAYEGFNNSVSYNLICDNIKNPDEKNIAFGAYYNTPGGDIINLAGDIITLDNYHHGEPSGTPTDYCIRICMSGSTSWCDNQCQRLHDYAICQRPKGNYVVLSQDSTLLKQTKQ